MVAQASALAEAKRAFSAWIAKLADNPRELALAIARRDYVDGVRAFRENSAIYRKVTVKNGLLTYEEALRFQQNQIAVLRLAHARMLEDQLRGETASADRPASDSDAAPGDGTKSGEASAQGGQGGGQQNAAGSDPLKQRLNAEAARVDQDVKTVAELESKFDDIRKVVESDAEGITQHRDLREYIRTTAAPPPPPAAAPPVEPRVPMGSQAPPVIVLPPLPQMPGAPPRRVNRPPAQLFVGTFAKPRPAPPPRYQTNPAATAQFTRPVTLPTGTHPQRPSTITGLDRQRVTGQYQPITRTQAQHVVGKYQSIPGGITLEGASPDLAFIKTVSYLPETNAFILNDDVVYLSPVAADEFLQIARALAADDKMGVSIGSTSIIYGQLPPQGSVTRNLKLADNFLGGIVFGEADRARGYSYASGFQPLRSVIGGNVAVYFNIHNYRFVEDPSGELRRDGVTVDITLVPLSRQKAADGGHGPDFDRIEKGDIPAPFVANVKHLQGNLDYYGRERIVRTTFAYGEIAAFARALKENAVSVGARAP
jgi:hypothetical protein